MQSKVPGDTFTLRHVDYIALQMFDAYSYSEDYKHVVQLKDQHNVLYHGKNVLTIVEIEKFLNGDYDTDDSRLAEWLRAIDLVNNEFNGETRNPYLEDLQNAAKLSNFDMDYLLTEAEGFAEGRVDGLAEAKRSAVIKALKRGKLTVEEIAEDNDLPLEEVLKIQKEQP